MHYWLWINYLWGKGAKGMLLFISAVILLFTLLEAHDIWTQEYRWAEIVSGMFYRQDFLHPYIGVVPYYDKPLLSYWLIAAVSLVTGELSTWTLRFPSVMAGFLSLWSMYRLGVNVNNRSLGLLSAWMLLTTYFFVFWARVSSADMLNMAGCLIAIVWYLEKKHQPSFFNFFIFFIIVALTSLCKGIAVVPLIAVFIDILMRQAIKQYLKISLILAILPAALIYLLPFLASDYFKVAGYHQSGLYLVYKENILRYFQPFDHRGAIYTYFLYLPIYLLPWTFFFLPALMSLRRRWSDLTISSRWVIVTLSVLFLFFTLSGSRRSYYVLPMLPFAICLTAEWILAQDIPSVRDGSKRMKCALLTLVITFFSLLFIIDILPAWYYSSTGVKEFSLLLKKKAQQIKPWQEWQIVKLETDDNLDFYLQLSPYTKHYEINPLNTKKWQQVVHLLQNKKSNTIFISRRQHLNLLKKFLPTYNIVALSPPPFFLSINNQNNLEAPIAFIPKSD